MITIDYTNKLYPFAADIGRWRHLQPMAADSREYVINHFLQFFLADGRRSETLERWLVGVCDVINDAPRRRVTTCDDEKMEDE